MPKQRIALFISGRGSNMQAIVAACQSGVLQHLAEPVLVFANQADAAGLAIAQAAGVATAVLPSKGIARATYDAQVVQLLQPYHIDYVVLAGYMRLLSPVMVQAYRQRIINIHPADTQQHQGLAGYQWAWEQRLTTTKITVHYVDEGLDTGNIIAQQTVDISTAQSLHELEQLGLAAEHRFYSHVLASLFTKT